MKKSTKGAVAAAAASVLLLGGAGSLAFWNDSFTVGGTTISSGHLTLTETTPGTCAAAPWKIDGGATFLPGSQKIVPGDTLTKNCVYKINASGVHLGAGLTTTGGGETTTSALDDEVTASGAFTIGGNPVTSITSANDTNLLSATITLSFPGGAATNASQDGSLDLASYVVTATQTHTP